MRICFFGDSFVNGTGDDSAFGWVGRVVAHARGVGCDVTGYNLGIRRDTSDDIAARWEAEAHPRLQAGVEHRLLFAFGANDGIAVGDSTRVPFERSVANSTAILQRAVAFAPTIVMGPIPVFNADTDRRGETLARAQGDICRQLAIPFLPVHGFIAKCEPWKAEAQAGDGAHPNARGYAALADFVLQWPALRAWLRLP